MLFRNIRGRALLVGDGDFSFAVALWNTYSYRVGGGILSLTASSLDSRRQIETAYGLIAKENIQTLENERVRVVHGVDATKLGITQDLIRNETRPADEIGSNESPINTSTEWQCPLAGELYDAIIFQHPHHCGKGRIDLNRKLLRQYFTSALNILGPYHGAGMEDSVMMNSLRFSPCAVSLPCVLVTLSKGQGGTSADGVYLRTWENTWQVVEQAAYAGLVLHSAARFDERMWESNGYRSTGRKLLTTSIYVKHPNTGASSGFDTGYSVTHIFVRERNGVVNLCPVPYVRDLSLWCCSSSDEPCRFRESIVRDVLSDVAGNQIVESVTLLETYLERQAVSPETLEVDISSRHLRTSHLFRIVFQNRSDGALHSSKVNEIIKIVSTKLAERGMVPR